MTLEELYYISQTVAVIAILASLVGVFVQIRQQSRVARSDLYLTAMSAFADHFRTFRTDPDFAVLYSVALQTWAGLSREQKLRVHAYNVEMAVNVDAVLNMRLQNLIDEGQALAFVHNMLGVLITPGGAEWWLESQFFFSPLLRDTLNKRLAQSASLPPAWTHFPPWDAAKADLEAASAGKPV